MSSLGLLQIIWFWTGRQLVWGNTRHATRWNIPS